MTYTQRLNYLDLPSLWHRRLRGDMKQVIKIINGIDDINCEKFFQLTDYDGTKNSYNKLYIQYARTQSKKIFQIGAGLYAVGRPVQKRNITQQKRTAKSAPINRFFGKPAHGPPHVAGGASGPIGGCRDESRTYNPDLDLRHVFDRNNQKTDLI